MEELANRSISRVPRITSGSSGDTLPHNTLRAGQLLVPRLEKSRDGVVTQIIGGERERKKSKWGVTLSAVELGQRHRGTEAQRHRPLKGHHEVGTQHNRALCLPCTLL